MLWLICLRIQIYYYQACVFSQSLREKNWFNLNWPITLMECIFVVATPSTTSDQLYRVKKCLGYVRSDKYHECWWIMINMPLGQNLQDWLEGERFETWTQDFLDRSLLILHQDYFALCQRQMFREMEILLRQPLSRRHCLHHCNQALHSGNASVQSASAHHKSAAYCCHKNAPQQHHASAKSRLHCIISLSWNVWTWSEYLLSAPSNKICAETDPGIRNETDKFP